jgi:alkylated DNA nucleotide flippase Atl1
LVVTITVTDAMEAKAKERLYRLVDRIPEDEVHTAERFLEDLAMSDDPVMRALTNAPEDDEPVTPEEEEAVREALEDIAAGRVQTLGEVMKELGH